ncbi:nucleoside-diphosphate sugar epimerase/dehydratase [Sphingomonas sp.]|uniref:nucleoside-diphosphate sugar epimerase/dehydratase n=1 Tax=Sphingomonas sp. TaxID=28214 RepID=UPI001D9CF5B0|nr:nucleoside-diphosphate sugar epimerase/dehydratase [Sphingomonas sp.]MBX9796721.1 polysaccharide biosynthesis protein [Sphingomonas sp.]
MTANMLIERLLGIPRTAKRAIALGVDAMLCVLAVVLAFYLRLGDWSVIGSNIIAPSLVSIVIALPIFVTMGLYRAIFRYAGWSSVMTIARAVAFYAIPYAILYGLVGMPPVPRTVGLIQPLLLLLFVGSSRTFTRVVLGERYLAQWRKRDVPVVLIYGAGSAGRQLAGALRASQEMRVVGFIDDDPTLQRATIDNVVVHGPNDLARITERRGVTDILLAIPSATRARRAEIVRELRELNLHVRTLPGVIDIARGNVSVSDLRELDIEDLLGRPAVPPDFDLLAETIAGKVVLVTGAGGSIGSELCRQIARQQPATLLLVEMCEYNLYAIHQNLVAQCAEHDECPEHIVPLLASVTDERRMEEIFASWKPELVFHAAAYKHVPLVEHNIVEGVRNNAIGTHVCARLAREHGTARFVLISTDKAVRPTNIMGASKRLSEMVLQAMNDQGGQTVYAMVRFGNVLGSSGSVVPLFRRQVAAGGPVTITHADITRYFMTIPEAAQLVLHAGAMATGGDVFVLDMGEPARIIDLARNIIELSGLSVRDADNPDGDIAIEVVGLRPGEKLYEELLIGDDPIATSHPRIMRARERFLPMPQLMAKLDVLNAAIAEGDAHAAQQLLRAAVPEYRPSSALVDWISKQQREAGEEVAAE